jgi:hypothetical protein
MRLKFNLAESIKIVIFGIFASIRSKFSIDDFIAKELSEISFRDYYNLYLKKSISQVEKLRLYNLKIIKFSTILMIFLLIYIYYFQKINNNFWIFSLVIFGILIFLANHLNQGFIKFYQKFFLENFFQYLGDSFVYKKEGGNLFKRYQEFYILPNFNSSISNSSDLIIAKINDCEFSAQKVFLYDKNIVLKKNPKFNKAKKEEMHKKDIAEFVEKDREIKITEGLVFLVDFPKNFSAKTVIKQVKSSNNPDSKIFEKVVSANAEFDKNFIIFSNSGVEFNNLFTNEFIESFISLPAEFNIDKKVIGKNDKISACFKDNSMLIFFENSHRIFEPSLIFQQLNLITESKKIIHQFNAIFRIIKIINPQ